MIKKMFQIENSVAVRVTSYLLPLTTYLLLSSCGGPSVPSVFTQKDQLPAIYPDYTQVTVPVNMAPLSFEYDGEADEMVARYAVGNDDIVCNGQPAIDEWHSLAQKAKGNAITVEVYTRNGDQWTRFKPFSIFVSPDSIDPYISYRLIAPSFISYEALTINQVSRKTDSASTVTTISGIIPSVCSSMPDSIREAPSLPTTAR